MDWGSEHNRQSLLTMNKLSKIYEPTHFVKQDSPLSFKCKLIMCLIGY